MIWQIPKLILRHILRNWRSVFRRNLRISWEWTTPHILYHLKEPRTVHMPKSPWRHHKLLLQMHHTQYLIYPRKAFMIWLTVCIEVSFLVFLFYWCIRSNTLGPITTSVTDYYHHRNDQTTSVSVVQSLDVISWHLTHHPMICLFDWWDDDWFTSGYDLLMTRWMLSSTHFLITSLLMMWWSSSLSNDLF